MQLLAWLDALGAVDSVPVSPISPTAGVPSAAPASAASRRAALAQLGRGALAAIPAVGAAFAATAGPGPRVASIVTDAFNLILRAAYVQQALLAQALARPTLVVPAPDRARLEAIQPILDNLIVQLSGSISLSGDAVEAPAAYDFTGNRNVAGGGPFSPFTSYEDFLLLAQVFGDTLSRTLINGLNTLGGNGLFAELLAQFLGTTSRLAADVRHLRAAIVPGVQPWPVDGDRSTLPPFFLEQVPAYEGEDSAVVYNVLDLTYTGEAAVLPEPLPARDVLTAAFDQPFPLTQSESVPTASLDRLLGQFRAM